MDRIEKTLSAISAVLLLITSWVYFAYVMLRTFEKLTPFSSTEGTLFGVEGVFMMMFLCLGTWASTRILKGVLTELRHQRG